MKKILILFMTILFVSCAYASRDCSPHRSPYHVNNHHNSHHSSFSLNFGFRSYSYYNQPRGYYVTQYIQVWVPPRQIVTIDAYGNRIITTIPGYYQSRPIQVWVNY